MEQFGEIISVIAAFMMWWIGIILRRVLGGGLKGLSEAGGAAGGDAGSGGKVGDVPASGIGALSKVKSSPPLIFRIIVAHSGQVAGLSPVVRATMRPWAKCLLCMKTAHMMAASVVGATFAFAISGQRTKAKMRSDFKLR